MGVLPIADSPPHNSSTELHTAKDATASTLYLLDRFAVSDQFYHELAQVCTLQFCTCICILTFYVYIWIQLHPEIPRLHHVKELRQSLNSDIEIFNLPQPYVGKYMDVRKTITKTLGSLVSTYYIQVHVTPMFTQIYTYMHTYS